PIYSCSSCESAHDRPECLAARNVSAVDVRGPEHGLAAMDEEARRRAAVRDHAISADAEHAMGHVLVRGDPATSVLPPSELRKRSVKASHECGQHYLVIEISDLLLRRYHETPKRLYVLFVPNMGCTPQVGNHPH